MENYIHTHKHAHTHIHIYICVCVYVCSNNIFEIWGETGYNKNLRKKTKFCSLGLKFPQKIHVTNACLLVGGTFRDSDLLWCLKMIGCYCDKNIRQKQESMIYLFVYWPVVPAHPGRESKKSSPVYNSETMWRMLFISYETKKQRNQEEELG